MIEKSQKEYDEFVKNTKKELDKLLESGHISLEEFNNAMQSLESDSDGDNLQDERVVHRPGHEDGVAEGHEAS